VAEEPSHLGMRKQGAGGVINSMTVTAKSTGLSKRALRRQRERESRRRSILEAAEILFARNGYRKTRIEDIADTAEVSVGAVYGYFKNKEELLVNVLDDIGLYVRRLVGKAFREANSPLEGIERAGMAFLEDLCLSHPAKVSLLYDESIGDSRQFQRARKDFGIKMIADVKGALMQLKDGLGVDYHSDISAEVMAVCMLGIYEQLGYYYRFWQKNPEEVMTIGRETISFIIGGIKNLVARDT
jgi:AcrR family transcriptional regulator